jgi:hypothetical protein
VNIYGAVAHDDLLTPYLALYLFAAEQPSGVGIEEI